MKKKLFLGVLITTISTSGSVIGFIVQILIANEFGVNVDVDAYFYSLSYPVFIAAIVASFYSYVLVPRLVTMRINMAELDRFYSSNLLFIAVLMLVVALTSQQIINMQIGFLKNTEIADYFDLTQLLTLGWFIGAAQILLGFQLASLNAFEKPLQAVILGLFPYVGMFFGAILSQKFGIVAVSHGMLIGYMFAVVLSLLMLIKSIHIVFEFKHVKSLYNASIYTVLAVTCFSSYSVIDAYWTSYMITGSLSQISYAQRVLIGFGSLIIVAPSMLLVPDFVNKLRDGGDVRGFFLKSMLGVAFLLLLVLFPTWYFSSQIVQLFFERGSFTIENSEVVAMLIRWMIPGAFFMLLSVIIFRFLFAVKDLVQKLAVVGLLWSILYFCFVALWYGEGVAALAQSYSVSWLVVFNILSVIAFRSIKNNG